MRMVIKGMAGLCLWALCWCGTLAFAEESPQLPQPEQSQPEQSQPEQSQPEQSQPEQSQPEQSQPEQSQPEQSQPEQSQPEQSRPESPQIEQPSQVPEFWEKLESCTIGEGEEISFTTISPENSGGSLPEGYYPGELTVEVTGPVTIESGGALMMGPLSIGGPEASPVLSGVGPIVVKSGGRLRLSSVILDTDGEGPFIIQEPGGSVELLQTEAEPGLVQWAPPLVNNHDKNPEDLWLESGTVLTQELLPQRMTVSVQEEGREEDREVALSWDLSAYDGQTEGELVLPGQFLDEAGQPLASALPLELTVHWYTPEELAVSDAVWKGSGAPSVQLTVENMPEAADVWGEVSADQGKTWERWDHEDWFFLVPEVNGRTVCVLQLPDDTPRMFRVKAYDPQAQRYWSSQAFALQPEESGDSEGNRGGSTAPTSPERDPEPAERPSQQEAAQPETIVPQPEPPAQEPETAEQPSPNDAAAPEAEGAVEASAPPQDPAAEPETPGEESSASLPETEPEPAPPSQEETAPASRPEPSGSSQALWVAAGAAVCAAVGVAAAKGPMPWKK